MIGGRLILSDKQLPHLFLNNFVEPLSYTTPPSGGGEKPRIPNRNHKEHGLFISGKLKDAWNRSSQLEKDRSAVALQTKDGMYLEFSSQAGYDLTTKSLEQLPSGIRLLNIRSEGVGDDQITFATVFVPPGKIEIFLKKTQTYIDDNKNSLLTGSIEEIRLAVLESFWQDDLDLIPTENPEWCEVWLRVNTNNENYVEEKFKSICNKAKIQYREGQIRFPERSVLMIKASAEQLNEFLFTSPDIAEFRLAKMTSEFWIESPNQDQAFWVNDLLERTTYKDTNVSICLLDTGVNNRHPLLTEVLSDTDCLTVDPAWGISDHHPFGHGTAMSGLATYGDIQNHLLSSIPIEINHRLESVKILPPSTQQNSRELWGHITAQAVSHAEIKQPDRLRINCMSVTAEDVRDRGRPSSWSAAIDALSSGYDEVDQPKRLFIISAGNIADAREWINYPESNVTSQIHDPGQSWNALTVGSMTNKSDITHPDLQSYVPIAPIGGLSPFSTTSLTWESKWPNKPDIVVEGGNAAKDQSQFTSKLDDLSLLTTHHKINENHFSIISETSASAAEASRMAAQIQCLYPNAWPETIRALMVHSSRWTDALKEQFDIKDKPSKKSISKLLRICGYGVPDMERALHCVQNSLTLIAQEEIQPFIHVQGKGQKTKDMHLYELPWPKEMLLDLGNLPIQLRVTLSYFIEPGPGEIGWKDRYRYPSCGLRFDLNSPSETKEQFLKRLNAAARENDVNPQSDSGTDRWMIGSNARSLGSIHSDIWEGTAADIATCNILGVYPTMGWWRLRNNLGSCDNKTRYSLIVSLHTPEQEIDIYTPILNVINALEVPVPIEI